MSFETPQMYRWRDPNWPREIPSLSVHFIMESQVNAEWTAKTGVQTYDNVLIAYVAPMGMPKSNAAHEIERTLPDGQVKVNQFYAGKYGEQIKHYKAGTMAETIGTPLKDLVGMTPAMAMNLRGRGIHTIEMLAEMPDGAGNELMGFWDLRDRAKKHLEHREKNAPMVKLEAMEEAHKAEVASLRRQLDELLARVGDEPQKRGPGRPPKVQEAA